MLDYTHTVKQRFLNYVQIDTQSDPESTTFPSSEKQKDLARLLVEELIAIGVADAEMDEHGYVFGTIPATNGREDYPTVCFCAHMDTAPDCSGTHVKPIVHSRYDGGDIVLPDDPSQIITTSQHHYLSQKIGDDIITASGLTLLGADDKAGVAIIMDLAAFLMSNKSVEHGRIRLLFTPDEEVGRGVEKLDMQKLDADFGYTLDGGELGSFETESFSADSLTVTFHGITAHPGYAKNKMINAIKVASCFVASLPQDSWSPETTSGDEGFVHPVAMSGGMEEAKVQFIIRSFDTPTLAKYESQIEHLAQAAIAKYPGANYKVEVKEQYRNMREILDLNPQVVEYAVNAIKALGLPYHTEKIRGGTDGSRLSFMGLPCPNLFTGEMAIHSKHEFVSVQDMEKAVKVCIEICQRIKP